MTKKNHLKIVGGTDARIVIPNVVQFSIKDLIDAFKDLTNSKPYIKVYLSKGEIKFQPTSTPTSEFTFKNPFGSNPEKIVNNICDAMNRYRGPIMAFCRKIVEAWNKENVNLSNMGFRITQLSFVE